jgi:hypothetical protein
VGEAGEYAEHGQAAAAFDAGDRGLRGIHPPGQLGLGPPGLRTEWAAPVVATCFAFCSGQGRLGL